MLSRRQLLQGSALGIVACSTPGVFAEKIYTSQMMEGPFYPDKMPLDTDNDLLILNDSLTPAVGEITHLHGKIMSKSGAPLRNAFVEIWQTDADGNYIHSGDRDGRDRLDKNFQGYGRFLTNHEGEYYFRTVKPVPYTHMGIYRAPHVHFAISSGGKRIFTTQMMVNGHEDNATDILLRGISDPLARETLLVDFMPIKGSKINALDAEFNIMLDHTAEEMDDGTIRGLGAPQQRGGRGGRGGSGPRS